MGPGHQQPNKKLSYFLDAIPRYTRILDLPLMLEH